LYLSKGGERERERQGREIDIHPLERRREGEEWGGKNSK
jgi:hypothetical protein